MLPAPCLADYWGGSIRRFNGIMAMQLPVPADKRTKLDWRAADAARTVQRSACRGFEALRRPVRYAGRRSVVFETTHPAYDGDQDAATVVSGAAVSVGRCATWRYPQAHS